MFAYLMLSLSVWPVFCIFIQKRYAKTIVYIMENEAKIKTRVSHASLTALIVYIYSDEIRLMNF
jgi:hypothetical protein